MSDQGFHFYDIVMALLIVGSTLMGYFKGVAWQVASISSLILSYVIALKLSRPLAPHFGEDGPWNRFFAMLVVYIVVSLVVWMIFRMLAQVIERIKLQEFDQHLGAIFGAIKGTLYAVVITFFLVIALAEGPSWVPAREGARSLGAERGEDDLFRAGNSLVLGVDPGLHARRVPGVLPSASRSVRTRRGHLG